MPKHIKINPEIQVKFHSIKQETRNIPKNRKNKLIFVKIFVINKTLEIINILLILQKNKIMSRGPRIVFIKKINGNMCDVRTEAGRNEKISFPTEAVKNFKEKDCIAYYTAEESKENSCPMCGWRPAESRIVALYKRAQNTEECSEDPYIWVSEGEGEIKCDAIPQIVTDLIEFCPYYQKYEKVIKHNFLSIFAKTHDIEALDALFSMPKEHINKMWGENIHVVLQIAYQIMEDIQNYGSAEKPSMQFVYSFFSLAELHGGSKSEIKQYINEKFR